LLLLMWVLSLLLLVLLPLSLLVLLQSHHQL
jgi:hypothetical protein